VLMATSNVLTLCEVIQAVSEVAAHDQETLATVVHLISSGQVRLSADAIKALRELSVTTNAAA
jgi:DNA-binding transcriptional regulator YiaG